jgi:hypothetical protein
MGESIPASAAFGDLTTSEAATRDPGRTNSYQELFINFAEKYENAADINHRMDQIWHK